MTEEKRFAFGKNWQSFRVDALDARRIEEAEHGLERLFGLGALQGRTVLDIGSGSGLMSLAAHRLGASRIVSFDFDPDSVACTRALRDEHARADEAAWSVTRGSVLDEDFVRSLGHFDVVYAWGVLHHTGDLWRALTHAALPVRPEGRFAVAIYNRVEGALGRFSSESWTRIKASYVGGSTLRQDLMVGAFAAWQAAIKLSRFENPLREVREYHKSRGMSWLHDARDWLGGYPYEFATVDEVSRYVTHLGFRTDKLLPVPPDGWGNNEFVFIRDTT
jgi:2-polyprenyl-6-hydroxyphenyl methylase/3-demethylubiquinone-9 3-methyltransferase